MRDVVQITKVGVVGGGLIGSSWASLFSAFDLEVIVYDPSPNAKSELDAFVRRAWSDLSALGLAKSELPVIPTFTTDLTDLADVEFVQENGPDRIEIKRKTIADLEDIVDEAVVISSSTSSLLASDIQKGARWPERIIVGHPMNPPHLVPMVELVSGRDTAIETMDTAEAFYKRLERVTIRVKKEMIGHLANRLTSALYREAVHVAAEGIADIEDIDRAIAYGPGMRWALMGPHLIYHLGGGKKGYRNYLDHLGPTQEARWRQLGTPELTDEVKEILIAGVDKELEGQDAETLTTRRDAALVALLKVKKTWGF
ncbi:MAG: 3-hydroxyacyl-CoA dehydrogenase NAD-binding domain-containing protein [Hyphomicrobiaceae bacterium]